MSSFPVQQFSPTLTRRTMQPSAQSLTQQELIQPFTQYPSGSSVFAQQGFPSVPSPMFAQQGFPSVSSSPVFAQQGFPSVPSYPAFPSQRFPTLAQQGLPSVSRLTQQPLIQGQGLTVSQRGLQPFTQQSMPRFTQQSMSQNVTGPFTSQGMKPQSQRFYTGSPRSTVFPTLAQQGAQPFNEVEEVQSIVEYTAPTSPVNPRRLAQQRFAQQRAAQRLEMELEDMPFLNEPIMGGTCPRM